MENKTNLEQKKEELVNLKKKLEVKETSLKQKGDDLKNLENKIDALSSQIKEKEIEKVEVITSKNNARNEDKKKNENIKKIHETEIEIKKILKKIEEVEQKSDSLGYKKTYSQLTQLEVRLSVTEKILEELKKLEPQEVNEEKIEGEILPEIVIPEVLEVIKTDEDKINIIKNNISNVYTEKELDTQEIKEKSNNEEIENTPRKEKEKKDNESVNNETLLADTTTEINEIKENTEIKSSQETVEEKQNEELISSLSPEEIKEVKKEMDNSEPLPFESKKTIKDVGTFLRNQIVKYTSGFHVSEKMKNLAGKARHKVLIGAGILTLWASTSSMEGNPHIIKPENVKGKITSVSDEWFKTNTSKDAEAMIDYETYQKLSPNARQIYLYSLTNITDSSYVIVDKPRAQMYVIGKDKKILAEFPVILGKSLGEGLNTADANSPIATNATTPAGKFKLGHKDINPSDIIEYKGKVFSIYGTDALKIHITYPLEYAKRTAALNSETPTDNRLSWGCINVSQENFDKYLAGNVTENTTLFITPDDPSLAVNPKTGKLEKGTASDFAQYTTNNTSFN